MLSASNLRELAVAMHNYHSDNGHLPPSAICDREGRPLLSWRVRMLPYIKQEALYNQFRLDEPWDSPHNIQLLKKMPKVFKPLGDVEVASNHTFYQVIVGKGAVFEPGRTITLGHLAVGDGSANTMLIVEGGEAVPWTQPVDLVYDPDGPLPSFGGLFAPKFRMYNDFKSPSGFNVAFADCSTRWVRPHAANEKLLRSLITWNGGENLDLSVILD